MSDNSERVKKWREKRKSLGLCIDCQNPSRPGRLRCVDCAEDNERAASLCVTRKILASKGGRP